jgi:formylmethanofuran dehydrogenase subunit A
MRLFLYLTFLVLFLACSEEAKQNDPIANEPKASEKTLLIAKKWFVFEVYADGILSENPNWAGVSFEIRTNKTYTIINPIGKEEGAWTFDKNETVLVLDNGSDTKVVYNILNLNEKELVLEGFDGIVTTKIIFKPFG